MIVFVPFLALVFGVLIGLKIVSPATGIAGQYLAIACLAGLDTVCGGIRSGLEGKFTQDVFFTGFISNVIIAFFLAWLGDRIFLNLTLASALVFGTRIFLNLSLIRRYLLTRYQDWMKNRAEQEAARRKAAISAQTESNA